MHSLWFLSAVLLAVPFFAVWQIRRSRGCEFNNRLESVIQPLDPHESIRLSVRDEVLPVPGGPKTRQMKLIKFKEFMTILADQRDLIVVDLRADAPPVGFPVRTASVVPVSRNELKRILGLLPTDRSVAFRGASNLDIFMIITSPCMKGSAPLYVLEGDHSRAEVA